MTDKINLPNKPGVYIFRDRKGLALYVGKALNLKNRVKSYFQKGLELGPKTVTMVAKIAKVEHIVVESEIEALLLEVDLIKRLKPKYNQQWKDDKNYKYIKIVQSSKRKTQKVTTSRLVTGRGSKYFGPFPEGKTVNQVLRTLRRVFPFRDCSEAKFKRYQNLNRPCLYGDLKLCSAPCVGRIGSKDYQKIMKQLEGFLSGKGKSVIQGLKKEMEIYSKAKDFEKAAAIRDRVQAFEYVTQGFRPPAEYLAHPNLIQDQRQAELRELAQIVRRQPPIVLRRIEAYDISNILGKYAVGCLVVFVDGEADKSQYRRFRIKTVEGISDVGMIKEVIRRRFTKIQSSKLKVESGGKDKSFAETPDLVVIDGGKPQVSAVNEVFGELGLMIPVLGLAKKTETVFGPDLSALNLPRHSPALYLLQRIRNEAHRFALSYHRTVRSRNLRN